MSRWRSLIALQLFLDQDIVEPTIAKMIEVGHNTVPEQARARIIFMRGCYMTQELRVLNPLLSSPLDQMESSQHFDFPSATSPSRKLMPSRFNARALTSSGDLIIWNSFTGAMNRFPSAQSAAMTDILSRDGDARESSAIGRYLLERGYLVPEGTDELRRVRVAYGEKHFRSDALELILLASEDCNFRCVYCYEKFATGTMRETVRTGIKRMLQRRAADLKSLTITWFGGEPLYGFAAIRDLAPFFKDLAHSRSIKFGSHMTTNGYLLDREKATSLLQWGVRDFQITLDGNAEQHDCRRKARDGTGTFHQILQNLCDLRKLSDDYHVVIRVNYDGETFANLEPFLDTLQSAFRGDDRFVLAFHPISALGGPNDASLPMCGLGDVAKASDLLPAAALAKGLKIETLRDNNGIGSQVCYAARPYSFVIGATGKIMKCTVALDERDYNVVGRLTESGEMEIDQDKFARWVEPAFENDKQCRSCQLLPPCQGMMCPMERMESARRPCPSYKTRLKGELLLAANS